MAVVQIALLASVVVVTGLLLRDSSQNGTVVTVQEMHEGKCSVCWNALENCKSACMFYQTLAMLLLIEVAGMIAAWFFHQMVRAEDNRMDRFERMDLNHAD